MILLSFLSFFFACLRIHFQGEILRLLSAAAREKSEVAKNFCEAVLVHSINTIGSSLKVIGNLTKIDQINLFEG